MRKTLVQIRLTEEQITAAQTVGGGNLSAGIRESLDAVRNCQELILACSDPMDRLSLIERALSPPAFGPPPA